MRHILNQVMELSVASRTPHSKRGSSKKERKEGREGRPGTEKDLGRDGEGGSRRKMPLVTALWCHPRT